MLGWVLARQWMAAGTACPPAALLRADCSAEDRLIELDVAEADCSDPVDVEQVDEVGRRAVGRCRREYLLQHEVTGCATEERAELVNVRLRAGLLHLVGRLVRDSASASSDKRGVDGHDRVDSSRPEPLAHVGCCTPDATGTQDETLNSFSRIGLRVVGHGGLVADRKLAKQSVEVLLKELAAVVG
eukprot:2687966-Pleurochrysis_carterae.AAC.1